MARIDDERAIIRSILSEFAGKRYAFDDIQNDTVFDAENDRYLVVSQGWDPRRVHGVLIHLDVIGDKIWIQRDGTEDGIATRLVEAGIPKNRIVLAFYSPEVRKDTEFAVA